MRWILGLHALALIAAGCASPPRPAAESDTAASPGAAACPELAAPPRGQCRDDADCTGKWVECAWGAAKPRPRATGSGALFGTDDRRCEHGYQQETPCPAGQAFRTRPAANLCPIPECVPRCAKGGCGAGELCDQGSGLCRPISCTESWRCAADQVCRHGPDADAHGCRPRCRGYGRCVVYGPPSP